MTDCDSVRCLCPLITRLTSTEVERGFRERTQTRSLARMTPNAGGSSSDAALVYNEAPWVRKRVVGRGNFGKARLLENVDTGELVVSKEAKLEGSEEARRKQSSDWSKEVELHSQLVHPHIIGYRGSFQKNDMFCIVMDYAAGGTLDGRIAQQREAGEPFCSETIPRWLAEMASALEHMHSHRVLHRDMKPANVLLSAEGEIKLADFGVSRLLGSQTSLAQTVLGPACGPAQRPRQIIKS